MGVFYRSRFVWTANYPVASLRLNHTEIKPSTLFTCLSLLLFTPSASAEEIIVENTSSSDAKSYSDNGVGWRYEGTVRSGGRGQHF